MQHSIWRAPAFRAYLSSTAFSGMALAMQQLLLSWILIGILLLPASQVGVIQALIGIPGIFLMLLGGARADGTDPRFLLSTIYWIAPLFSLFLIAMEQMGLFAVWNVLIWGLGIGFVQSLSMPAQQAILNRSSGSQVQQGVTAATVVGFVVQVVGLAIAGLTDTLGVSWILACQAAAFALAGWMILRLPPVALPETQQSSALSQIKLGLGAIVQDKVILHVLVINFTSSIFNAGSFMTVFPFIVKRVYDGNALLLSALMALFFAGAALSNAWLLKYMPLLHPGRLFLVAQLSRIVVLGLLFLRGDMWLLVLATFLWGLNMGVTTNLARTIVQESAVPEFRGRIMSVFSIGMVGSAPIGAIILGLLIESVGTLNALIPAILLSLLLFIYGVAYTGVWQHQSAQALAALQTRPVT